MKMNPLFATDSYKWSHILMYPPKTEMVYSTWTPRAAKDGSAHVVVFGVQAALRKLNELWRVNFFARPLGQIQHEFERTHKNFLLEDVRKEWTDAITRLHGLGYLPLEIKALPEGTLCPIKTPYLTIKNTDAKCAWLTNFVETFLSTELWLPATDATIAYNNRKMVNEWAIKTGVSPDDMNFLGHGFEMRGMQGIESGMKSGAAHLLSWWGTDTLSAIPFLEEYYDSELSVDYIAGSVPASEHSVMSAWGQGNEKELFEWLITKRFPTGILSVVSDTWNIWKVVGEYLPELKDKIMARDGKLVIRPDSGDPADILCGLRSLVTGSIVASVAIRKLQDIGVVEALWQIFGGTTSKHGYKVLNSHIGVIYGDSMNYKNVNEILGRLEAKGFAANNVVFGFGSYNYTYVTRDTYGFALKSTACVVDGEFREIFKDPITDNGLKKSQRGMVVVNPDLTYTDGLSLCEYKRIHGLGACLLKTVFCDGEERNTQTFKEIRERLWKQPQVSKKLKEIQK